MAFGVARYFHWYCPCFPASRHHQSWQACFKRTKRSFLLLLFCLLSHYSETRLPPPCCIQLLRCCWERLGTVLQVHPCIKTFPEGLGCPHSWLLCPLSHPTGYFFLIALAKSGHLPCPRGATWQLLRSLGRASQPGAGGAAVQRTGKAHTRRTAALYICHIKLRAPSLALYQLLACC